MSQAKCQDCDGTGWKYLMPDGHKVECSSCEGAGTGWTINLIGCTDVILQDIGCKQATRKDVALTYAMAIKSQAQGDDKPDWGIINRAILSRWSMSGLEWIKKRAFDILTGKVTV